MLLVQGTIIELICVHVSSKSYNYKFFEVHISKNLCYSVKKIQNYIEIINYLDKNLSAIHHQKNLEFRNLIRILIQLAINC